LTFAQEKQPTHALAYELQVDECFAGILPEKKAEIVEKPQQEGKTVCFVGDGINDAIALKKADVSVSLRGASTAATDTAQIILMDGNLEAFTEILDMSRTFESRQKTNLILSVIPGAVSTAGVFLLHFGLYMAMAIYYGGLGLGIGNSVRPLISYDSDAGESQITLNREP
jgi:Cu2+-exporting ATPase